MRSLSNLLLSLLFFGVALASAQTIPAGTFKHIIIVVQENRTPDNLFGAAPAQAKCGVEDPFELGVDIENGGYGYVPISTTQRQRQLICNTSLPMNDWPLDPGHFYEDWTKDYNSMNMDGFCHEYNDPLQNPPCPSYSYVPKSDAQPYFDIATGYGFANYFFQTNQGPSFPAHQFLFTGTSAPVAPNDSHNYYLDFIADNPGPSDSGCPYNGTQWPRWVLPDGTPEGDPRTTKSECYPHDSLVTAAADCGTSNCDKGFSWRYYTPTKGIIWDAPEGVPEVCYGQNRNVGGQCTNVEFTSHVVLPTQQNGAPIFNDIATCTLPKITWVIPDKAWSDHPADDNTVSPPLGPSWVGDIADAVGNSWANSNHGCDYWGTNSSTPEPTAIFVVWDDWGGFFDHVPPPAVYEGTATTCPTTVQPNGWGCGYVYGFRVPLLVVSEYTQAGYVSGALPSPGKVAKYEHDFGSILAFTEYNFGMQPIAPPFYADANTLDSVNSNVPLSDFFSLSNQRNFTNISTPYPPSKFTGFYTTLQNGVYPVPTGPDGTSGEED
jgi:phospholipase C